MFFRDPIRFRNDSANQFAPNRKMDGIQLAAFFLGIVIACIVLFTNRTKNDQKDINIKNAPWRRQAGTGENRSTQAPRNWHARLPYKE